MRCLLWRVKRVSGVTCVTRLWLRLVWFCDLPKKSKVLSSALKVDEVGRPAFLTTCQEGLEWVLWCVVMCCDVLWCVVMCCDVLWCVVMCCDVLWCVVCSLVNHFVASRSEASPAKKVVRMLKKLKSDVTALGLQEKAASFYPALSNNLFWKSAYYVTCTGLEWLALIPLSWTWRSVAAGWVRRICQVLWEDQVPWSDEL